MAGSLTDRNVQAATRGVACRHQGRCPDPGLESSWAFSYYKDRTEFQVVLSNGTGIFMQITPEIWESMKRVGDRTLYRSENRWQRLRRLITRR